MRCTESALLSSAVDHSEALVRDCPVIVDGRSNREIRCSISMLNLSRLMTVLNTSDTVVSTPRERQCSAKHLYVAQGASAGTLDPTTFPVHKGKLRHVDLAECGFGSGERFFKLR